MRALEKRLGLSGLNYRAEEKIKLMQDRIAHAKATIDTSAPRGWAEKHDISGHVSPSKAKVAARERAELISLDNMLLARRIFNIMEAPSAISEIINDTRHLDVHPGTMNYKARVEESEIIHRDNLIMAQRLGNIKPYYGYEDLNANRGMLQHKHNARKSTKNKKVSKKATDGSLSARGPEQSPNQHQAPSGSQSARGASSTPKGVLLRSFKMQNDMRIDVVVLKEPLRDQYGILGKCAADGKRYEAFFSSEEISTLVDGDLLVTNPEKPEVWKVLLKKVELKCVDQFRTGAAIAEELLSAVRNEELTSKSPTKPKDSRPTSRAGGRAGKANSKKPVTPVVAAMGEASEKVSRKPQNADDADNNRNQDEHAAATKLQALQRAKKAKQETEKLRAEKHQTTHKGGEKVADNNRNQDEHAAATKLQALQRAKKAKQEVAQMRTITQNSETITPLIDGKSDVQTKKSPVAPSAPRQAAGRPVKKPTK